MSNTELLIKSEPKTERMMLAIDKETKEALDKLKYQHSVDVPEMVRRLLKKTLKELGLI